MKLKLEDVTTGSSASKIISNFKRIQRFINYQTVKRQVEPGEPNEMWTYLVLDVAFPPTDGFRLSQSVLEVLHKPESNLLLSQSVIEVLHKPTSDLFVTQSVLEVLHTGV
jgi:hypothetical protein